MDELTENPVEGHESSDAPNTERQALDDATLEPRATVEQTGDFQQAEDIQNTLTSIVDNSSKPAGEISGLPVPLPISTEQVLDESQPAAHDNPGATPLPIPRPEDDSLHSDLDQLTPVKQDDRHEATPIPLPGNQEPIEATPPPPPDLGQKIEVGHSGEEVVATQVNLPGAQRELLDPDNGPHPPGQSSWSPAMSEHPQPGQPAEFEKPILNQELEDLDAGLGNLDDLDSLIPGPGKLSGAPGEADPGSDLLGGLGFSGGPGDLKNDLGGPHDEPPPGGFPSMNEMKSGGKKHTGTNNNTPGHGHGYDYSKDLTNMGSYDKGLIFDPNWEAVPKNETINPFKESFAPAVPTDYEEHDREAENFSNLQKDFKAEKDRQKSEATADEVLKFFGFKDEPDEGTGKKDPNIPISQQMEGDRVNPKFDQDQISNYPEDLIEGSQGGGMLSEEHTEAVKRTLDNKAKLDQSSPKAGAEQVTDPPEPQPGRKSETSGKGG